MIILLYISFNLIKNNGQYNNTKPLKNYLS